MSGTGQYTVQVSRATGQKTKLPSKRKHFSIIIDAEHPKNRKVFEFRGPVQMTNDNIAPTYNQVARPGRLPLLVRTGGSLQTLSFDVTLGYTDNQQAVQQAINQLKVIARTNHHILIPYSQFTAGHWRCTALSFSTTMLNTDNDVSRATASLTFTRVSDMKIHLGPASGGATQHHHGHKKATPKGHHAAKNTHTSKYTVKKGDTLWSICLAHYGDPTVWRTVADQNSIKNLRHLKPGTVIQLP